MGFWDSIKNAAIKAKCGVGIHGGVFKTPDGKPECHLEKTCPDCNTIIEKKEHKYNFEWDEAPFDIYSKLRCTRIQSCIFCGEVAKKEVHGEYKKLGVNASCQVVMACTNCGHEKTDGYEHVFLREGVEDGKIIMKCVNCGFTEKRKYI